MDALTAAESKVSTLWQEIARGPAEFAQLKGNRRLLAAVEREIAAGRLDLQGRRDRLRTRIAECVNELRIRIASGELSSGVVAVEWRSRAAGLTDQLFAAQRDLAAVQQQHRRDLEAITGLFRRYGIPANHSSPDDLLELILRMAVANGEPGFELKLASRRADDRNLVRLGEMRRRIEAVAVPKRECERLIALANEARERAQRYRARTLCGPGAWQARCADKEARRRAVIGKMAEKRLAALPQPVLQVEAARETAKLIENLIALSASAATDAFLSSYPVATAKCPERWDLDIANAAALPFRLGGARKAVTAAQAGRIKVVRKREHGCSGFRRTVGGDAARLVRSEILRALKDIRKQFASFDGSVAADDSRAINGEFRQALRKVFATARLQGDYSEIVAPGIVMFGLRYQRIPGLPAPGYVSDFIDSAEHLDRLRPLLRAITFPGAGAM